ncbi:MAG: glycosyltransferase family 39 protein [Acidobacteria bacterium]|nr:glycosyltransferase family 39 protein [Acidobacteriota bacterium]
MYPKLTGYLGTLMGGGIANYFFAGIIVSWVAFLGAMVVLYLLARLDLTEEEATRAVLYSAVFPFAFFFGVIYAESVFLLFTLWAFYGFRTRGWLIGGLAGGVATATRPNGIYALPAVAWIAFTHARNDRRQAIKAAVAVALFTSGIVLYSLFVYIKTGSPLEWVYSIQRWNYHPGGIPGVQLVNLIVALGTRPFDYLTTGKTAPYDTLNGLAAIVLVLSIPGIWWRFGAGYGLFVAANLWVPLSSGWYEGLGRYCSVLFPFFMLLAAWSSRLPPAFHSAVLVTFATLYAICLALFTKVHPLF